jgi:hypothetical protein
MDSSRRILGYVVALAGPVVLSVLLVPLRTTDVGPALALVLVVPLVAGAALAGRGAGVGGALVTAACFDFFFTRPYNSFTIHASEDVVTTVALLLVGAIVAELVVRQQRSDRRAADRERDVRSLRRVAGVSAGFDDRGWLIHAACAELAERLDADIVDYVPGPARDDMARLGHGRVVVPSRSGGDGRDGWPVTLPVGREGQAGAHLVVWFDSSAALARLSPDDRAQAVAVADLLGAALAREARPSSN